MANKKGDKQITFIDLFAGIGGFHLAFHELGAKCVFASEWNDHARKTYEHNFRAVDPSIFDEERFAGDITKIVETPETIRKNIPEFDILTGGFPCQPFSNAGYKKGFKDPRGTLFYDVVKILEERRPPAFFLENVRHLYKHDNGETFKTIKQTLLDLDYTFDEKIVKASDFGLPQHRARLFMVGFDKRRFGDLKFEFPEPTERTMTMSDVFGKECSRDIGFTLRVGGRGSSIDDRRNWDAYLVGGKVVRLSPIEGKKMMGFPDDFHFPVSDVQAMKQLGNAVAVPAIQATAGRIIEVLKNYGDKTKKTQRK